MLNDVASSLFLRFLGMISIFAILGPILANLNGFYPLETRWTYLGCIYFPCEMIYWTYFYRYAHGSDIKFTDKQTYMWWFILFGYSFGAFSKFFTYYNVVFLFVFSCASNFFLISVYWPDEKYLKTYTAVFRLVITTMSICGMAFINYMTVKGRPTATGQLVMFSLWTIWLFVVDHFFNKCKYDLSHDLAMTVLASKYFTAFIIGSTILVYSTNDDESESGTASIFNVIRLTIFFAITNGVGSGAISRFVYGNNYAAMMFGVQMYVNFSLDILFVSSDLLYSDFWIVLLWTSGYHVFRNTGKVEDISEWFRIRYGSTCMHSLAHWCCTCGADDVEILKEKHRREAILNRQQKAEEDSKMLMMKTQGELLQLLTPCVLMLMVIVDVVFVEAGLGNGSITVGMSRSRRPYAIGVFFLTFIFKYGGVVLSREMLLSKRRNLTEQIKQHKNIPGNDKAMDKISTEMDVLEAGQAVGPEKVGYGDVVAFGGGVEDEDGVAGGDGGFFMDKMTDMDADPLSSNNYDLSSADTVLVYAERRLEITNIYLSCLLITAKRCGPP